MTVEEVENVIGFYKIWRICEYLADTGRYMDNANLLQQVRDKNPVDWPQVMPIYAVLEGSQ